MCPGPDAQGYTANEADDWTRPLKLSREARKTLCRMGWASAGPAVLYGLDQELSEHALRKMVDLLLEPAGLKPMRKDQHHWLLRELARLLRTRHGHEPAFYIELKMGKWMGDGLSPQVMGFLVTCSTRSCARWQVKLTSRVRSRSQGRACLEPRLPNLKNVDSG